MHNYVVVVYDAWFGLALMLRWWSPPWCGRMTRTHLSVSRFKLTHCYHKHTYVYVLYPTADSPGAYDPCCHPTHSGDRCVMRWRRRRRRRVRRQGEVECAIERKHQCVYMRELEFIVTFLENYPLYFSISYFFFFFFTL